MDEDVTECYEARFWEMVPGSIVGTLLLQVILCYKVSCVCFWSNRCGLLFSGWWRDLSEWSKDWDLMASGYLKRFWMTCSIRQVREGADEHRVLKHVHSIYNDIGVKDLTVEIEVVQWSYLRFSNYFLEHSQCGTFLLQTELLLIALNPFCLSRISELIFLWT
jgi:hypothetical protein